MATTYVLGMDAKLYEGAADAALAALTEVDNVKDVTVSLETGEADVTTRGNSGWRATASTLKGCTVEFTMQWKPGDTAFEAIKDAFLASTTVRLAPLTGARGAEYCEGPFGNYSITNFSRNEPLEESITVSVTAKLSEFEEWITDGAEAAS